jgi:hypothetical protein
MVKYIHFDFDFLFFIDVCLCSTIFGNGIGDAVEFLECFYGSSCEHAL